jgi:ElaB/YqjD/DUF883 family membrane-anchored ribosome-binding protein
MANEEVIRQQMEETRTSLTEKLETLEQQVVETVQGATSAVSDTVANIKDSVQETVSTVKDTVEGTVSAVKDTVAESVDTVKEYMDVTAYVEKYPWLSLGASIGVGFLAGKMLGGRGEPFKASELAKASDGPRLSDGPRVHRNGGHRRRHEPAMPGWLAQFGPELAKLKGLALGALLGTAREMIRQSVPGDVGAKLGQIVDNITNKIGGEPMSQSDMERLSSYQTEGARHESRDEAKMGGSMGATYRQGPQAMGRFDR